jgi:hypothetical protein
MYNFYKINEDGALASGSGRIIPSGFSTTQPETKEDGKFYDYYNQDGTVNAEKQMEYETNNVLNELESTVEEHINNKAKELGYNNIDSIAKYMVEGNPFKDECVELSLWTASCWNTAFNIQQEVLSNSRGIPSKEELLLELPEFG